jgi:hypothetical protein
MPTLWWWPLILKHSLDDSALAEVVRRYFNNDLVSGKYPNIEAAHFAGEIC